MSHLLDGPATVVLIRYATLVEAMQKARLEYIEHRKQADLIEWRRIATEVDILTATILHPPTPDLFTTPNQLQE